MNIAPGLSRPSPTLSLHQLTALDASPVALIEIAGRLACDHVCLFTHVPDAARHVYPLITAADVPGLADALAAAGVTLCNLEVFPLDGRTDVRDLAAGLRVGAALGATRATAHIHDADAVTAVRRFADFAKLAADHGIVPGLEFNAFSAVTTISQAAAIVRAAGHGSVVLDTLHLMRSGGGAADVAAAADLIGYVQVSDGPAAIADDDRWREAVGERMVPGNGTFPLADILAQLAYGIVIEVEVPQKAAMKAGLDAATRCARAVRAARSIAGVLA